MKLLEDPRQGRKQVHKSENCVETRTHIIGLRGVGNIVGLEEAIIGKKNIHNTSAVCLSFKVHVYRVERDIFV